ncbi:protease [Mycoplasmatota bacterium]|nr:protease [Mycoplasmatota bacterium]
MKIKVHLITEVYLIICLISGYFYEVMTIYLCLIIHEIGHYIMIKIFKKDILLLEISPLGGILHIDKCQNDKNYKELLIYISGPIASLLLYLLFYYMNVNEILLRSSFYVLILNLLPILPLDGAKIIMSLKQFLLPYRKVLKLVSIMSLSVCFLLIILFINHINYIIILVFFVYINLLNYKENAYTYYNFLWYKYIHPNEKLKEKIIVSDKSIYNLFYKGFNHIFYQNYQFVSEREVLKQLLKQK